MMVKKEHISIIIPLIAIVPLVVAIITSFIIINAPESYEPEPEVIIIQEEYRIEMLAILRTCLLYADPTILDLEEFGWPRVEIAPGVEVFYDRLALYAHVFGFRHNPDDIASLEDIISLYDSYDKELDRKLRNLRAWLGHGGEFPVREYLRSIGRALDLYTQQFGAFNGKEDFIEMRVEDMIELERFVSDNRSFMPKEKYYRGLYYMNIIDRHERDRLAAAAAVRQRRTNANQD